MADPSGSTAFSYDRRGNVEVESHNVAGNVFTYGYGFDINGNRYVITYPDGTIVTYGFDFADRPVSAQQLAPQDPGTLSVTRRARSLAQLRTKGLAAPVHAAKSELPHAPAASVRTTISLSPGRTAATPRRGLVLPSAGRSTTVEPVGMTRRASSSARPDSVIVSSATYAPFGPMTSMAFGNGTTQTMIYNQRYFPQENKLVASGRTLVDQVYSADAIGNITAVSDMLDSGYSRSFGYDDLNRLTTANSGSKLWGTASGNGYAYDAMGNMLSSHLSASRTVGFSYQPGYRGSAGLPLLSAVTDSNGTHPITNDPVGSQTSDSVDTMAYGARELMGSALPNLASYAYDGFRRRVQTQTPTGLQRVSLYDMADRLLAESSSASPSSISYDYVWFGDRPVAELDTATTHWTVADHLGTPFLQTENTGAVSWQAEYEPYGTVYALRAGDVHQPLRLPGQEVQQFDTGAAGIIPMSYNGARWYQPTWGRYTQSDPLHLGGGMNLFGYANSRPLNLADPSGEWPGALAVRPGNLPHIRCPKWGLDRVIANIRTVQHHPLDEKWYKSMVGPGEPWDYKAGDYKGVNKTDLIFLGNFNFGATGYAIGVPTLPWLLEAGATTNPKDPTGPEPGGSGKRGWHGIGGTWPYGEQESEAEVERDGWIFGSFMVNYNINLCKKDPRRVCPVSR